MTKQNANTTNTHKNNTTANTTMTTYRPHQQRTSERISQMAKHAPRIHTHKRMASAKSTVIAKAAVEIQNRSKQNELFEANTNIGVINNGGDTDEKNGDDKDEDNGDNGDDNGDDKVMVMTIVMIMVTMAMTLVR